VFQDLRDQSADATIAIGFEGYAIGGLSVGEPIDLMYAVVSDTAASCPRTNPRISWERARLRTWSSVSLAASTCSTASSRPATPERAAVHQRRAHQHQERAYAEDDGPVDPACGCYTCRTHSEAYLRHLYLAGEMTAGSLNTLHNLTFYLDTMRRIREAISLRTFDKFRQEFLRSASRLSLDS
jgi:queuine tRNA-ribosyltransferase